MKEQRDTNSEMIERLRQRIAELEQAETDREATEKKSRQNERRYRKIFDWVPISIWEEDFSQLKTAIDELKASGIQDFKTFLDEHPEFLDTAADLIEVTDVNPEALRLFGARSKSDLRGSPAKVLIPGSLDAFRDELVAIAEKKSLFETEAVSHTLDGERINVMVRIAIPSDPLEFQHMLLTVTDLTGLKRTEEALRKSEERFRAVFESARDCIYIKDRNLRFTHVNPALEKLLGRPASELVGRTAEDLYGQEAGNHIRDVDHRVLAGELIEEEHTRPVNGVSSYTFHDIRVPLRNTSGEITGICGISRDITERKRLEIPLTVSDPQYPSPAMQVVLKKARHVAATDSVVLLLGESGSGKDFVARQIHAHSKRSNGPFFEINCAALSPELAESELFGHEPGAFTGARGRKRGLLELAEGGTLLLNEIGELSTGMQAKLLTFMDSRSFTRVAGEKTIHVNARLIAATHRDLKAEVSEGRFLQALFYRLDVFSIRVPPLRERLEDIPVLAHEILTKLASDICPAEVPSLDSAHMRALCQYHWPGNVRELRNVLERALIVHDGRRLDLSLPKVDWGDEDSCSGQQFPDDLNLHRLREQLIQSACKEALRRARGNKRSASVLLGVSRFSFYRYLKYFGIGDDVT